MARTLSKERRIEDSESTVLSEQADEQLFLLFRDHGNQEAFEELYRRYEHPLRDFAYRILQDYQRAEDAVHEAFMVLCCNPDRFDPMKEFRSWFYTVAANKARDIRRRNSKHRNTLSMQYFDWDYDAATDACHPPSREESPEISAMTREHASHMRGALERIHPNRRAAIEATYFQGRKYRETASALGVTLATVRSRVHTGLRELRELYCF